MSQVNLCQIYQNVKTWEQQEIFQHVQMIPAAGSFLQADLEIIPKETQCTDVTFDFANDSAKVSKRINLRAIMAQV